MLKKKFSIVIISVFLITVLSSCAPVPSEFAGQKSSPGDVLFQSENTKVVHKESKEELTLAQYLYLPMTEEMAYGSNQVILEGVVSNLRSAEVAYEYTGGIVTEDITLFDFTVSSVILGEKVRKNHVLALGVNYNQENYGVGLPILKEGGSYLMFCQIPASDGTDPRERYRYVDLWAEFPKDLILEKVGDDYLATEFLASYGDYPSLTEILDSADNKGVATASSLPKIALERTDGGRSDYGIYKNSSYLIPCNDVREMIRDTVRNRSR